MFFGLVNRGLPPPAATVVHDPQRQLALDIYRPAGTSGCAAPVVVFFYGGAWQRGSRAQYAFVGARLSAFGVLAIVADYRTWPRAGFPDFVHDAARAVAWAHANAADHGGDPHRLYLAGHSAGAQIAALLATDARYLQPHGLAPSQLAGVIGMAGPYDFRISGEFEDVFGAPAQWPDAQALNFVDGDEPPFLLIHGDADRRVHSEDSRMLAAALRDAGLDATLLVLEDAGHGTPLAGFYSDSRAPRVLPAILRFVGLDSPSAGHRSPSAARTKTRERAPTRERETRERGRERGHPRFSNCQAPSPIPASDVAPPAQRSN